MIDTHGELSLFDLFFAPLHHLTPEAVCYKCRSERS